MEINKHLDSNWYVDHTYYARYTDQHKEIVFLLYWRENDELELTVDLNNVLKNIPKFKICGDRVFNARIKDAFSTTHWGFLKEVCLLMEQCCHYKSAKEVVGKAAQIQPLRTRLALLIRDNRPMRALLLKYEQLEADTLENDDCWRESEPRLDSWFWDKFIELQSLRNRCLHERDAEQLTFDN